MLIRRLFAQVLRLAACAAAGPDGQLYLSFSSYRSSPAAVTHFGLDRPLQPMNGFEIASGAAEQGLPRSAGGALIAMPGDAGGDGVWQVELQWVELLTQRAYRSTFATCATAAGIG